jgi:hypothetical protein
VQNLVVMKVMPERNVMLIRGSVPGANQEYLVIQGSKKRFGEVWKPRSEIVEAAPVKGFGAKVAKTAQKAKAAEAAAAAPAKK